MKTRLLIIASICLLLIGVVIIARLSPATLHDPRDLAHWSRIAASRDWSEAAARGEPQAQCLHGLSLIRTNLYVRGIDRIPGLSTVPVIGKRYFEKIFYDLDNHVTPEQLADAYRWIKQSADQGFTPAKEAQKLFIGKTGPPTQAAAGNMNQQILSGTNQTSSATDSKR